MPPNAKKVFERILLRFIFVSKQFKKHYFASNDHKKKYYVGIRLLKKKNESIKNSQQCEKKMKINFKK